jgi:DNA modification methylase
MRDLPDNSVDSVVCDPPYHLTSIVKRFGAENAAPAQVGKTGAYARASKGFMGQTWDGGDVAFRPETWAEVLRVLKPGGHLVAFSGTRTYHRMAVAIEDAGFEVRDMIAWHYGAGFPKSHNIDKALGHDERCCCKTLSERDLRLVRDSDVSEAVNTCDERGEVLLAGLSEQGSSGAMLRAEPEEGSAAGAQLFLEGRDHAQAPEGELQGRPLCEGAGVRSADGPEGSLHHGASAGDGEDVRVPADANGSGEPQGSQPGEQSSVEPGTLADERRSQAGGAWPLCGGCSKPIVPEGLGSALKPATEPICLARKPLSEKSIAANCLKWGTGALNIDGCRIATDEDRRRNAAGGDNGLHGSSTFKIRERRAEDQPITEGRWPANLCHDGSDEVLAGFPESESGSMRAGTIRNVENRVYGKGCSAAGKAATEREIEGSSGSAARFFYCAKATTEERGEGNNHPTVKPVALMRWLCRLVTPKGGTVLDPFMGSGSTALACDAEHFDFIGCELSPEYAAIAERRIRDAAGMFAEVKAA